jgi:acyl carrier protein
MSNTIDRLRLLLVKDYKLDPGVLVPDAPLDELGIDSLGVAELMFNIEDEFKIAIPGEPVALKTVGDVVRYIDGLIATQHEDAAAGNAAALRAARGQ